MAKPYESNPRIIHHFGTFANLPAGATLARLTPGSTYNATDGANYGRWWKVFVTSIGSRELIEMSGPGGLPGPQIFSGSTALGGTITVWRALPVGVPTVADDITIFAALPFPVRLTDSLIVVATAGIGGSTVTLRSAAAGAGTALSTAFSSAATGYVRNTTLTATPTLAAGSSIFARRTDGGMIGEAILTMMRTG